MTFKSNTGKSNTRASSDKRRWRSLKIGRLLPSEARTLFRRRGFAETAVLTRWREVVGEDMARRSMPTRLSFPKGKRNSGTLYIRVDGPFATEVQHLEPLLVEKINAFYGYGAVAKISITQGPIPRSAKRGVAEAPVLDAKEQTALDHTVDKAHDEGLRGALKRLGRRVLADGRDRNQGRAPPGD